ncbi:MAG: response regulator [Candidatus Dormibacteraeota bacterium]|nr:response regulator [Candidatus Dormibacteraeota bacterium]
MSSSSVTRPTAALLVDDDPTTTAQHARRLEEEGYRVTKAGDAVTALSLARQSPPDIIFVHMGRGGSGSTQFIQALRANDVTRNVRVALLSSYYDRSLERLGLTSHESW